MPVITGALEYPDQLVEKIKAKGIKIVAADTLKLAKEAGNERTSNVALIGLMGRYLGFDVETLKESVKISVPAKFLEVNLKAFELGYNYEK
jgi:indolepyruvate ferredoxin oxidoreductase beta subunit